VFPEGGTSNGSAILGFKKGAFSALLPVTPVVLKYKSEMFYNAYDIIEYFPMFIMQNCVTDFTCTLLELPPFIPNDYLFCNHATSGKEKWEIYAEAVRQVMSKASGIPTTEASQREKIKYQIALGMRKSTPAEHTKT
jgi:lysophosphatidylcholine acyltransferase/lyso-PAF acetyltransferase